mmetsp:Transcript_45635/g.117952  ORF Transcript_45635/g.117952 Transcript_45635/m.117952 type:complete len:97 (-) Transcript_45635:696-986(-)
MLASKMYPWPCSTKEREEEYLPFLSPKPAYVFGNEVGPKALNQDCASAFRAKGVSPFWLSYLHHNTRTRGVRCTNFIIPRRGCIRSPHLIFSHLNR